MSPQVRRLAQANEAVSGTVSPASLFTSLLNHYNFGPDTSLHSHPLYDFNLPDKPWRETFGGVRRALRHLATPDQMVSFYCKVASVDDSLLRVLDWPTSVAIPFFSKVKTAFHHAADTLAKGWTHYLELGNIAGYPDAADRSQTDDPRAWLETPVLSDYSTEWWTSRFTATFSSAIRHYPEKVFTLEEFAVRRWLWTTPGASSFSQATLDDKIVRTKFGAAISLSDEELLAHVHLVPKQATEIGIFIKPDEMGYKRRLIANVSLGPYIIASYLHYLMAAFVGHSPVYTKLETTHFDTLEVISLIREGERLMPLDESSYDYHVTRESWLGFITFLQGTFPNNAGVEMFRQFFSSATWNDKVSEGRWLKGMPSGLALTSYLNSWMNYIKQVEIVPGKLQWAAGDDVLVSPYFDTTIAEVSERYKAFGAVVNKSKNWESRAYGEYLKVLIHASGTTGYPARVYGSLLWARDVRTFLPSDKLPELAELFKQFYDRLGLPLDEVVVSRDLSRAVSSKVKGFNSVVAREWLHSPRAYGGFGCLPYNDIVFDWKTEVLKKQKYKNIIIRVPDINFYSTSVELVKRREPFRTAVSTYLGPPLRLPPVETVEQWESRLNGEDNPVKGKFSKMALDIIPLPTIDGVSTSNMAKFARSLLYHVFPNLRGSSGAIPHRLVMLSLQLATEMFNFMKTQNIRELAN